MSNQFCILNGKLIKGSNACISPFDRGFMYGDGIFDTLFVRNGQLFLFDEHITRLLDNLSTISITHPYTIDMIRKMITELIDKNNLTETDAYVRTTITRGINAGQMFYKPTEPTLIILAGAVKETSIEQRENGVSCTISKIVRLSENPLSNIKSLNFLWSIYGMKQAAEESKDDCIFINDKGNITECSTSNIFIVKDGVVSTPYVNSGILPGVTRDYMIDLLKKNAIPTDERAISKEEMLNADELFLTSSVKGVTPVRSIGDLSFNNSFVKRVQDIYFASIP
ncbi:aminotransferase class IV [Thermodesulfobacteriota bacterium]